MVVRAGSARITKTDFGPAQVHELMPAIAEALAVCPVCNCDSSPRQTGFDKVYARVDASDGDREQ